MLKDRKEDQYWVEPFVGGANMIDKVEGNRIGADFNVSLIMCLDELSKGWLPPEFISREEYNNAREAWYNGHNSALIGYIGINGSYGGRWFDGGYAGISETNNGKKRNYPLEAFNNVIKQLEGLKDVNFISCSYQELDIPDNSLIYCDPPYYHTKEYTTAKKSGFDTEEFWQWCRDKAKQGHTVFISEYQSPEDFMCIWEKGLTSSMRANGVVSGAKLSTERLFVHEDYYNKTKELQNND